MPVETVQREGVAQSGAMQYGEAVRQENNAPSLVHSGTDLIPFFAVGLVINIAVLAAFFVWAFRQWKRK